jgi:hypothetical protein
MNLMKKLYAFKSELEMFINFIAVLPVKVLKCQKMRVSELVILQLRI